MNIPNATRALQIAVTHIFDTAIAQLDQDRTLDGNWSVQGFGLLRLYVRGIGRIHIWTDELRYNDVSMVHNHAWDLKSTVVCGELHNTTYIDYPMDSTRKDLTTYNKVRLKTGFDSELLSEPTQVKLYAWPAMPYRPGDEYAQTADAIHRTDAINGTVTIMERKDTVGDGHADVFWPYGTSWGTAKPRAASRDEVRLAINQAMRLIP